METLNNIFISLGLANCSHVDVFDSSHSFAIWLLPDGAYIVVASYLAFPTFGLRVCLQHGTIIAWPGFAVPHCTMEGRLAWKDGRSGKPPSMMSFFISRSAALDSKAFRV